MAEEMMDLINAETIGSLIPGLSEKASEALLSQVGAFVIGNERYVPRSLLMKQLQASWMNAPEKAKPAPVTKPVQMPREERMDARTELISDLRHQLALREEECEKLRCDNRNLENAFSSVRDAAKDNVFEKLREENDRLIRQLREYEKSDGVKQRLMKKNERLDHDLKIIRDVCAQKDEKIKSLEIRCRSRNDAEKASGDELRRLQDEADTYRELAEEAQRLIVEAEAREKSLKERITVVEEENDILRRKYDELSSRAAKPDGGGDLSLKMSDEFFEGEIPAYINMLASERLRNLQPLRDQRKRDYDLAMFLCEYTQGSTETREKFRRQVSEAIEKAMDSGKTGDLTKLGFTETGGSGGNCKMAFRDNGRYTIVFTKHPNPVPRTVRNSVSAALGVVAF